MKTMIVLFIFVFSFPAWAVKDLDPELIDRDWIEVLDQADVEKKKQCSDIDNFPKQMACQDKVRFQFEKKGDYRGNEFYINKRYKHIDAAGLKLLIVNQKDLIVRSRTSYDLPSFVSPFERGELSQSILNLELYALQQLLKDNSPKPCVISLEDYYASIANPDIIKCGK